MPAQTTNYDQLASQLSAAFDRLDGDQKHWIGLAGSPGSGKSTVAEAIRRRMPEMITVISMDGYHYYRRQLNAMEDPEEAYARRGAPFTFDAERLVDELRVARQKGTGAFPSFDHRIGDPVERDIELRPGKQVVIVEGNYLLLDESPWASLKNEVFDATWFLDVEVAECRRRVEERHVGTGLTKGEARHRVSSNDGPNAELVRAVSLKNASLIVRINSPIDEA
jgi:pantothenate kinase